MYKRTLRILSCGGGGRSPGRATLNSVERVLLAAAFSSCSVLCSLLRQLQMAARTRRAVAIAASGGADLGAGCVNLVLARHRARAAARPTLSMSRPASVVDHVILMVSM